MTARAARIGVVEDNVIDVEVFRRAFGPLGIIERWPSGEALAQAQVFDPGLFASLDLLLVDLGLPGIDGVEVVRAVRASPDGAQLPIVMLTGSAAEQDIIRALRADITEYEVKPDDVEGLRALVGRCQQLLQDKGPRPAS